ncbi:MAG: hypothetical protein LBI33_00240 [Propionibacteriaceae bacterium]|jgi:hypothetical protein|nr:hypothetical protein [Propionibacteriaceae bacterium]
MAIEESLLDADNRFTENSTTRLIESQSDPYMVTVSDLLDHPQTCVEAAFQNAQQRNGQR